MKLSNILFAVYALIVRSSAFEEGEEPCPDVAVLNDCFSCVTASCGYVADEGDCVKDCQSVSDSDCFSTDVTEGSVAEICALAAEVQNGTSTNETSLGNSWTQHEFEEGEEPCPDVAVLNDCFACVTAKCGYVADEGDCVKDCLTVEDSVCFSTNVTEGEVADICALAAEAQNGTSTNGTSQHEFEEGEEPCPDVSVLNDCFACVTAKCGYVADEGDCVKDCLTVTDSVCFSTSVTEGEVADICALAAEAQSGASTATTKETATKPTSSTGGSSSSTSGSSFKTTTAAPKPTADSVSSADSFMMTSLVQWTLVVASAGFVMSQAGAW